MVGESRDDYLDSSPSGRFRSAGGVCHCCPRQQSRLRFWSANAVYRGIGASAPDCVLHRRIVRCQGPSFPLRHGRSSGVGANWAHWSGAPGKTARPPRRAALANWHGRPPNCTTTSEPTYTRLASKDLRRLRCCLYGHFSLKAGAGRRGLDPVFFSARRRRTGRRLATGGDRAR